MARFLKAPPQKSQRDIKLAKRKEYQIHKAKLKKSYYKMLNREAITPPPTSMTDSGPMPPMSHLSDDDRNVTSAMSRHHHSDDASDTHPMDIPASRHHVNKQPRIDPLAKVAHSIQQEHQQKQQARLLREQERKQRERQKHENERQRKINFKKMQQKTNKGQPVMAHRINSLLSKIKSDMKKE